MYRNTPHSIDLNSRRGLVAAITVALINEGEGSSSIAAALKWRDASGTLGYRDLLELACSLGVDLQ